VNYGSPNYLDQKSYAILHIKVSSNWFILWLRLGVRCQSPTIGVVRTISERLYSFLLMVVMMTQVKTSAGPQISFADRDIKSIERNIAMLIRQVKAGDFLLGFQVSPAMHVLGSLLKIDKIEEEEVIRHMTLRAAINLQGNADIGINQFMEALGAAAKSFLQKEIKEFHILFPLNTDSTLLSKVSHLQIRNITFELGTWKMVEERYDIEALTKKVGDFMKVDSFDPWNRDGIPLMVKIRGRNANEVFQRIVETYDLLISSINYLLDMGVRIQLQSPEPLGVVRPAVGYGVFLPDGKLEEPFVELEQVNFQTLCREKFDLDELFKILALANRKEKLNSTIKIYFSALLTYNAALLTSKWTNAYLGLWQALEWVAFDPNANYDMKNVVERICILIKCSDSIRDFLHICAKRRNELVHRGQFSTDGQSEVLILKQIVRASLGQILQLADLFPNRNSLNEYFVYSNFSREELIEKNQVIKNILNSGQSG
jgi:hypothetical protein